MTPDPERLYERQLDPPTTVDEDERADEADSFDSSDEVDQ